MLFRSMVPVLAAALLAAVPAAESQILAEYTAAPLTDQIVLSNVAECPTGPLEIAIYLSGSAGELVVSGDADAKLSAGSKIKVNDTNGDPVEVTVVEDALFLTITNFAPGHGIELNVPLSSELDDGELQAVRAAGATEVHLRSASPQILYPDFYGIDMPERDQLIAANMTLNEMRAHLEVDSLGFLSVDGLYDADRKSVV